MRGGQPALGPLIVLYPPKKVLNQFEATKQLGGLSRTWGPASISEEVSVWREASCW